MDVAASFKQSNVEMQEQKLRDLEREQELDRQREEYAKKKEAMDQLRKDKEEQKFKEKQETRQKLIQRQTETLMNIKNKDEEILNKQVQQAEEKALHLFNEQERKKREMKEAIERSRHQQILRKQAERNYEK